MFTIVIPCKNENQGLVKTINTIPKEIPIIVADSSTDNTLELLHGDIK
jgi:glycosyltransferase involved in cell wall biosynthesis